MNPQYQQGQIHLKRAQVVNSTDDLKNGYAVCYDSDATGDGSVAERTYNVEQPKAGNLDFFAGVIAGSSGLLTAPAEVQLVVPDRVSGPVNVWTDQNVAAGDILGPVPGSYACRSDSLRPIFRALEAQDRSSIAGLVRCEVVPQLTALPPDSVDDEASGFFLRRFDFRDLNGIGPWTLTLTDGGGDASEVNAGGFLKGFQVTTNDATGDGSNLRALGLEIDTAKPWRIKFEAVEVEDASASRLVIGLSLPSDSDILGGVTDRVVFEVADGGTSVNILAVAEKDSTQTNTESDTGIDLADATALDLEISYDGSSLRFYIDDALVATYTTNIPSDEDLVPVVEFEADGAAAEVLNFKSMSLAGYRG